MAHVGRHRPSCGTKMSKSSRSNDKHGAGNKFANDGSFMELFRKKMEEQKSEKTPRDESVQPEPSPPPGPTVTPPGPSVAETVNKPNKPLPFVGKRRGSTPVLKTGAVKKTKRDEEDEVPKKDAWSQYLAEVKKYKEQSCQEENKTRPLVK